jgi:hypothetical protein
MLNFITLNKLAEGSGYSKPALHKKIHDGVLKEGIHYYRSPDGRIHFNIEEYEKWVRTYYRKA